LLGWSLGTSKGQNPLGQWLFAVSGQEEIEEQ
jgi:hypothetical protein